MSWQKLRGCLGIAGLAGLLATQVALGEEGVSLPIKKIWADAGKQVVVEFTSKSGAFPQVPHILDLPGPNHRVVLDFSDAEIDRGNLASAEDVSAGINKVLPFVKGVRYSNLANTVKPTARIVFDLPEELKVKPRVVRLEEGQVTISFGEDVLGLPEVASSNTNEVTGASIGRQQASGLAATASGGETLAAAQGQSWDWSTGGQTAAPASPQSTVETASSAMPANNQAVDTQVAAVASSAEPQLRPEISSEPASKDQSIAGSEEPARDVPSAATLPQINQEAAAGTATSETTPGSSQQSLGVEAASSAAEAMPVTAEAIPATAEAIPAAAEAMPAAGDTAATISETAEAGTGVAATQNSNSEANTAESVASTTEAASESLEPASVADGQTAQSTPTGEEAAAAASTAELTGDSQNVGATEAKPADKAQQTKASNLEAIKRYNIAVQLHLSGKLSEAVVEYQAAIEANPGLAEAYSNLGLIYNQQHNYAQALAEFRKALAVNPRDAITYNGIGAALRAQKDLLGAIKNWQTAVSLDAHLATAHYNLGTAYEIQKDYDRAMESYRLAVKNDYRLGEAYYRVGLIMERKHRSDEAAQNFRQALKVSANSEYSEDARQRLAYLTQSKKTARR